MAMDVAQVTDCPRRTALYTGSIGRAESESVRIRSTVRRQRGGFNQLELRHAVSIWNPR